MLIFITTQYITILDTVVENCFFIEILTNPQEWTKLKFYNVKYLKINI